MKLNIPFFSLFFAGAMVASAASCGTLASASTCFVDVNNQVRFSFSNFRLLSNNVSGTAALITAEDIGLSAVSGGGLSAAMSFNKVVTKDNPNIVFVANAGALAGVKFSYDVAISALTPGTVLFVDPAVNSLDTSSTNLNGQTQVQMILSGAPVCLATAQVKSVNCTLAPGTTTTAPVVDSVVVSGNSGNASIGQFSNLFNATFTPDTGTPTPEPATFALIGGGLIVLYRMRRR